MKKIILSKDTVAWRGKKCFTNSNMSMLKPSVFEDYWRIKQLLNSEDKKSVRNEEGQERHLVWMNNYKPK